MPVRVLPVMDLKGGRVVHARSGKRAAYQPLQSPWTDRAADPLELTRTFKEQLQVSEWYLADLDALEGRGSQAEIIHQVLNHGTRLWLDVGVRSLDQAQPWADAGVLRLIIASESLPSQHLLEEFTHVLGADRLVFSLDLHHGEVRLAPGAFPNPAPLAVVDAAVDAGFTQFIFLDTGSVGTNQGPTTGPLCQAARRRHPRTTLLTGGGVRNRQDLAGLAACGVDIALVATALHTDRDFARDALAAESR